MVGSGAANNTNVSIRRLGVIHFWVDSRYTVDNDRQQSCTIGRKNMLPSSLVDVRLKKALSKHMALNRSHSIKIESTFWIIFDFNSLMEFLKNEPVI